MSEMNHNAAKRVAQRAMKKGTMVRVAGEVRFIKDRGGDHQEWGWNPPGSSERTIDPDYKYNIKHMEPMLRALRSTLMALGHCQSAYATFTKIKSQTISPDGNLGGKGYVMPIKDIRKFLMNSCEALSAVSDTLFDEKNAPHWVPEIEGTGGDPRARNEVKQIIDDIEEIKEDPEDWAEEEEEEMDEEGGGSSKLASSQSLRSVISELMAVNPAEVRKMASIFPEAARMSALIQSTQTKIRNQNLAHRYMAWRNSS